MRVLVIDDSKSFQLLLVTALKKNIKRVKVTCYDFKNEGSLSEDYDWSKYDILLLDYKLGKYGNGLDILQQHSTNPKFPPTIFLTTEGSEYVAVKAIKLGANDYINKANTTLRMISNMVYDVLVSEKLLRKGETINQAQSIISSLSEESNTEPKVAGKAPNRKKNKTAKKKNNSIQLNYKLIKLISKGMLSQVYLAERYSDGLAVALKVLDVRRVTDENIKSRFLREASIISQIVSPFIVKIYGHGVTEKYGHITMEFLTGGDLKAKMEKPIEANRAIDYAIAIAFALVEIHSVGIIHRDLKPGNIMFRDNGKLVLTDFGISKKFDNDHEITNMGQVLGTPHYMSPEQCQGHFLDLRSDLYSIGVLIYEMLSGKKPYDTSTVASLIYQHVYSDIPKLPKHLNKYQTIIDNTMAKEPEGRYQDAMTLITALKEVQAH